MWLLVEFEWPCHRRSREYWCDWDGPGDFMGHTCVKPLRDGLWYWDFDVLNQREKNDHAGGL
jgi:hypothetical protein